MAITLQLGEITAQLIRKDIRNVHLSVYPPAGRVKISAPLRMNTDTVRVFAISRLAWIKQQRKKIIEQERESPREFINRESHYVWGRRYLMNVIEKDAAPAVELKHRKIVLHVRPGTGEARRNEILEDWYRTQIRQAAQPLIAKWEPLMGVKVDRLYVQRMKTKWGSCSRTSAAIRLNTDLARKPPECLEYIVVHEMVHLLEPTHNRRFIDLMDRIMPRWQHYRQALNRLPLKHETWQY